MNFEHFASNGVELKTSDKFPGLTLLNYSQIDTPKSDPECYKCRGHIVDSTGNYVCRPFDRFFNYGEQYCPEIDWATAQVVEKVDGSLIKIYHYNDKWHIGTRGTFDAASAVGGHDITFAQLVIAALGLGSEVGFQRWCNDKMLSPDATYLFELTSLWNRVIVPHTETKLWLLGIRFNESGEYVSVEHLDIVAAQLEVQLPKRYQFDSVEHCLQASKELPFDDEGYVVYDKDDQPVCKIKSPAYVAVHRIRGEGLTPNRICQLVWTFEETEYLAYFSEDIAIVQPYVDARDALIAEIDSVYASIKDIADQKEYALVVKDKPYSGVLFTMRKQSESCSLRVIEAQTIQYQQRLLQNYMADN